MDPFEAFESKPSTDENDPAAEFLAREQAELEKIENNDFSNDFSSFGKQIIVAYYKFICFKLILSYF